MDDGILRVFRGKELDTRVIGKKIYKYDTVGSTNDSAFMYALKGEKEGAVFWARSQTKGRGRLGRQWISHKDKGLYFSLILRPDIVVNDAPKITLLVALSICKALGGYTHCQFLIKWPNDIFVDDKKIGGILTEMDAEIQKVRFLVVGIGINTNLRQNELPLRGITSLRVLLQKDIHNENLLGACLKEIDRHYFQFKKEGISDIIEDARHFSSLWGKQVKVNGKPEGTAVDFDNEGALVVRQNNGFMKHIFAGDVELLR
ncbi:MAG: biotin--[acetyl-CoA-carboxylase] ligase [Omnitrophica WOR_2 bacterium GWF2_43_52]|nr:MAG: biotin--[acetyl-CoA-carboxylase] ligase [Omnitrophica WOR_2 bacterium GWF2_43_52]HAH19291.1 biotin--[acetyl-CoA-carboxylase] ligase [Candidatus Omnitrophota bacterium]HBG63686.1 biotin--[acetyl-CoA-carboxylase] ligase [Candidatus Omnitrophota bacterium]HCD37861.1 biotin--[acetyl-CoA-carboxylase] ligase [Candidatus Omnitrophota bacterium]